MTYGTDSYASGALSESGRASTGSTAQTGYPQGFCSTAFGTPTSNLPTAQAYPSGFASGGVGTPVGSQGYTATTIYAFQYNDSAFTKFGIPTYVLNHVVSGFSGTKFGTPTAYTDRYSAFPSGFCSTAFGTPIGSRRATGVVSGFCSTVFGTPTAKYTQIGYPQGFSSTQFGRPTGPMYRKIPAIYSLNKPDVTYVLRKL